MSPTGRVAVALGVVALLALVVPVSVVVLLVLAVGVAAVADAVLSRDGVRLEREVRPVLSRGVASPVAVDIEGEPSGAVRVRQPVPPELALDPDETDGALAGQLTPRRRGRYQVPPPVTRHTGPLGLVRRDVAADVGDVEVAVFPDLVAARKVVLAVRHGRFRDPGRRPQGPLGLGTEFELIREYSPDDDIRQVNWRATARVGRPMSNQYRVEQDREVLCLVDAGRLMTSPVLDRSRLDVALDAVTAVALVADELGDRCGAVAFDREVRRDVRSRRGGGATVVRALFDLEPRPVDSDYELAFRTVGAKKRALILVFTDLLEEAAARPLLEAVPVLARRHAIVVASTSDPDLDRLVQQPPATPYDVYAASVAVDVLAARRRVVQRLRSAGAEVVEAPPGQLGHACVAAYLRLKRRARL